MATTGGLTPIPRWQIFSGSTPVSGAKLYTYLSGTSTPQTTYADAALATPHTNPVVADDNGVLPVIYLDAVSYRFLVTDSTGVTIFPAQDNISGDFANVLSQTITIDVTPNYTWTFPAADAAGVLQSDGAGTLSLTKAPTLTTPTMTVPVVSDHINLTGGQITFPATQVPSSNANTLDDYEEGLWTPVLGGDGGTTGQTYTSQHGFYVKVGRMVFCNATVTLSAKGTITGGLILSGFPYAVDTTTDSACAFGDFDNAGASQVWVAGVIGSAGYVQLRHRDSASTTMGTMSTTDVANTTALEAIFFYVAAN